MSKLDVLCKSSFQKIRCKQSRDLCQKNLSEDLAGADAKTRTKMIKKTKAVFKKNYTVLRLNELKLELTI